MNLVPRCIGVLMLISGLSIAQPAAFEILQQVIDTYRNAKTFHFKSESESTYRTKLSRSMSYHFTSISGTDSGNLRYQVESPMGSYTVVQDGENLWIASDQLRQFVVNKATEDLRKVKEGGNDAQTASMRAYHEKERYSRITERIRSSYFLPEETIEIQGQKIPCYVIHATYDHHPLNPPMQLYRTFWIDKDQFIILRDEAVTRGASRPDTPYEEGESHSVTRYQIASVNKPISDGLFTYSPPAHYLSVTEIISPYRMHALNQIGSPAIEFQQKTMNDVLLRLSDFKGKTVLLDFWASWCQPCRMQTPFLTRLHAELKDQGLIIIGINKDATTEDAQKYIDQEKIPWSNLFDPSPFALHTMYKAIAIPALVLISPEGKIVEYQVGAGNKVEEALNNSLRKLGFRIKETTN